MDRRTGAYRDLVQRAPQPSDIPAGSGDDPLLIGVETRCRICSACEINLPNGTEVANRINRLLLGCCTYRAIFDDISPLMADWPEGARIAYDSIRRHSKRHVGFDAALAREIAERRAAQAGRDIREGIEPLLTVAAVYELVLQQGYAFLGEGHMEVKLPDVLKAGQLLSELEREAPPETVGLRELARQYQAFVESVKEIVPEKMFRRIVALAEGGPYTQEANAVGTSTDGHTSEGGPSDA